MLRQALAFWLSLLAAYTVVQAAAPTGKPLVSAPDQWAPPGAFDNAQNRNCWVTSSEVTARWTYEGTDATEFRVRLYDQAAYAYVTSNGDAGASTGSLSTSWTTPTLLTSHRYKFSVAAANDDGTGPWSEWMILVVSPDSPPVGIASVQQVGQQVNGQGYYITTLQTPLVHWDGVAGAVGYTVAFHDESTNTWVTGDWFQVSDPWCSQELQESHIYTVAVLAGNEFGWGTWWSGWMTFVVSPDTPPVGVPVVTQVGEQHNGQGYYITILQNPPIQWTGVDRATKYTVAFHDESTNTWVTGDWFQVSGTSWTPGTGLPVSHVYKVAVKGGNDFGWGPWSGWMTFVVSPDTPPVDASVVHQAGDLDSQKDCYVTSTPKPEIHWDAVAGAVVYTLAVKDLSTNTWVTGDWIQVSGTSWTPSENLQPSHIYEAAVLAGNDFGWGESWSGWMTFVVTPDTPPVQAPVISYPTGNIYINDPSPCFVWGDVAGAVVYWLSIKDTTAQNQTVFSGFSVSGADNPPPVTLTAGHSYEAQVVAHNDFGWGPWSDRAYFTVDTTPPVITATFSPERNANGWNNTDVTVTFAATDSCSGVASLTIDSGSGPVVTDHVNITSEGTTQITASATDYAWNTATSPIAVKVDKTAPVITATVWPSPIGGWNNDYAWVFFEATDALSGIASVTDPVLVTAEGSGHVISGTATDFAGNSDTASVTVNIDKPPVITATMSPEPNEAGWNKSNVTVTFTATDGGSGVVSVTGSALVSTEAEGQIVTGTATDRNGKTSTLEVVVNLDKTAPIISILPPYNDGTTKFTLFPCIIGGAWASLPATVSDNFPPGVTVSPPLDHAFLPIGEYMLPIIAQDAAGNQSFAYLPVKVEWDGWLLVPDDIIAEAEGPSGAHVTYPAAEDTQQYFQYLTYDHASGDLYPMGPTDVTVTAHYSNGTDTWQIERTFTIRVKDRTPPAFTAVPASLTVVANTLAGADNVVYGVVSATDLVTPSPTIWFEPTCEGTVFPVGITLVHVYAMDNAGNLNTAAFTVTVMAVPLGISNVAPADGSITSGRRPELSALVSDGQYGLVEWSTLCLRLDGNPVAATHEGMTVSYTPPQDLAEGHHEAEISVCDAAGNFASLHWHFAVVLEAPGIDFLSPFDGSTVYVSDLTTVCAWFSDSGAGVDPTSAKLYLDGILLPNITATASCAYASVSASFNAWHQVTVVIADNVGRTASKTNGFYVIDPDPDYSLDLVVGETKLLDVTFDYPFVLPLLEEQNGGYFRTTEGPYFEWWDAPHCHFWIPVIGLTGGKATLTVHPLIAYSPPPQRTADIRVFDVTFTPTKVYLASDGTATVTAHIKPEEDAACVKFEPDDNQLISVTSDEAGAATQHLTIHGLGQPGPTVLRAKVQEPIPQAPKVCRHSLEVNLIKVELNVTSTTCTLMDTNDFDITWEPNEVNPTAFRIEMNWKGTWYTLSTSRFYNAFVQRVAGHFSLRGAATFGGKEILSSEVALEVQFPDRAAIAGNATVEAARAADWTAACGAAGDHNERGGFIFLNTQTGNYRIDRVPVGNYDEVVMGNRAPDGVPQNPIDGVDSYFVATFHLHPTLKDAADVTTANAGGFPRGSSPQDLLLTLTAGIPEFSGGVPGLLRDRHANEIIETGHTDSFYGPERRQTPP